MGAFSGQKAETNGWQLVYQFTNFTDIPTFSYDIDNSGQIGTFSRILYLIKYSQYSVWCELDDFTGGLANRIGLPISWVYDVEVTNIKTYVNNPDTGFPDADQGTIYNRETPTGRINFWPSNYATAGTTPEGNDSIYDHNDSGFSTANGYGSMQVFDTQSAIPECIFSWSGWGISNGGNCGLGSNTTNGHTDWTFNYNANNFPNKLCRIYVL